MASDFIRTVRFSLDLDVEQRNFLRLYAAKNDLSASIVLRAMIHILQSDPAFSNRILDLIFVAPEADDEEFETLEQADEEDHLIEDE